MNPTNNISEARRLWKKITDEFRLACLHRRAGKTTETADILDKQLPADIAAWGRVSGRAEPERRRQLNEMFETEQRRVEDMWLSQQIILRQMRDILIPSLCLQVAEEVREIMEYQVEQITRMLANSTSAVTAAVDRQTGRTTAMGGARIVNLPSPTIDSAPALPKFSDLPAIIDDLIKRDLQTNRVDSKALALV